MKLIDGDALIAWIKESQHMTSKMRNIICKVETMPSADRPQGGWLDTGKDPDHSHPLTAIWYKCSECGDGTNAKTNFCPNCGARMKGVDDERKDIQSADE